MVLFGSLFWAIHFHIIDWFVNKIGAVRLAFFQFIICSILSLIFAINLEIISIQSINQAIIPILYAGLMSVGIAYTLQVIGQRDAHPSHAAIILSLEAVFAGLGGWMLLSEVLSLREIGGCSLMLIGMMFSQMNFKLNPLKIASKK